MVLLATCNKNVTVNVGNHSTAHW